VNSSERYRHGAGTRPGGRLTFLASPRKVSKRRRPCFAALPAVGFPAMLAAWAPRPTRCATLRSDKGRESSSRGSLRSRSQAAALLGGCTRGPKPGRLAAHRLDERTLRGAPEGDAQRAVSSSPCAAAEKRRSPGRERSELQRLTSRRLFERSVAKRVRRGPGFRASQGTRRAAEPGAVSLLTFLGVQESESPAGASPGTVANDNSRSQHE